KGQTSLFVLSLSSSVVSVPSVVHPLLSPCPPGFLFLLPYPHRQRVPRALLGGELLGPRLARGGVAQGERVPLQLVDAQDGLTPGGAGRDEVDGPGGLARVEAERPRADLLAVAVDGVGVA